MGLLPSAFWEAVDAFVAWADSLGLAGLGILTFTEAAGQPIPPEALLLPMLIAAEGDPFTILLLWLCATLTSVAGAVLGHWIGGRVGRPLVDRFVDPRHVRRLETLTRRYGDLGVFIAAISPIPYKVFAWLAGMGEMDRRRFIIAGLLGRGMRFGIEAVVIGIWGATLMDTLTNPWIWLAATLVGVAALIPALRWWDGLLDEEE